MSFFIAINDDPSYQQSTTLFRTGLTAFIGLCKPLNEAENDASIVVVKITTGKNTKRKVAQTICILPYYLNLKLLMGDEGTKNTIIVIDLLKNLT